VDNSPGDIVLVDVDEDGKKLVFHEAGTAVPAETIQEVETTG
jgi:hypothetical protein